MEVEQIKMQFGSMLRFVADLNGFKEVVAVRLRSFARVLPILRSSVLVLFIILLPGCAGMTAEEQQAKRAELDEMGERAIAKLLELHPDAKEALSDSVGYTVIDMKVTKVPVLGGGSGLAVTFDKRSGNNSYAKVSQFEVGGGIGAKRFKVVVFFTDENLLDRAIKGAWHFEAGAELSAGAAGTEGKIAKESKGYRAFKFPEGGAAATITVLIARATPYL